MKILTTRSLLLSLFALLGSFSFSQFKITGEVRPRMEYRHGFKALPNSAAKHAIFVDQRTRLNFDYTKNKIAFRVSLQDVRVWGNQSQLVGNEDFGTSIHEAWGRIQLKDSLYLKFGRQELVYDDHRILGNVGWAQQARSHDAVFLQWEKKKFKLHFGGAYNQNAAGLVGTDYTVNKSYKSMQMGWANFKFNEDMNLSVLALSVGQQVNYTNIQGNPDYQDNYTLTAGTRFVFKKKSFGFNFNGYYQLGSTNEWPKRSVSAYNLGIDAYYKVKESMKFTLGFEMLSGNSQTDTTVAYNDVQHAFNPYFGTNHKFNGLMDYFYVGNHIGNVGLNDIYFQFDYEHKKFSLGLAGHAFLSNADILDVPWLTDPANTTGEIRAMSSYMGAEIDFFGGFKIVDGASCKFGYSHMLGTESMEAIKGGDRNEIANWGWVMVVLKPTLFEQKPKEE
ncbi:MAG: alginate export family protein [Crocinitomicaceae bacterium]|nr:alginate export family protein [Crocinitomicaceae bacterium]